MDCYISSDTCVGEVENPNQRRSTIIIVRKGRIRIGGAIDAPDGEESLLGGKLAAFANQGKANKRVRFEVLVIRL